MLITKKGKIVKPDGIQLPNDKVIKSLEEGESYKYLGAPEANKVMLNEMKDKVKKRVLQKSEKSIGAINKQWKYFQSY